MKEGKVFCFHHGWHFLLADEFPMQKALEKHKDKNGRCFYELDYIEENWERVRFRIRLTIPICFVTE